MAKDLSVRIAIGHPSDRHSTVWSFFTTNSEVYAAHRTGARVEKFSFHSSRICRRAYVDTHPLPPSMSDRVFHRWNRAETSPAGEGKAVAVLSVIFPEGHLSPDLPATAKKGIWLPAPVRGEARILQVLFTREGEEEVRRQLMGAGHSLVLYHGLPNGEAVAIRSWANEFEQRDLIVEASHGVPRDLVLPSVFEVGVKRPVGLTMYLQPDEMRCIELSGYWVAAGEARRCFPMADTLSRNEITERSGQLA